MAAPTPTARQTPTGKKVGDGYQTFVTFKNAPAVSLWEITVKPVGIDGGDPVETTTMHNIAWRTKDHRHLKTLMPSQFKAAYDPDVISDLYNLVNKADTLTVRFPDGGTLCFYGYLQKFEPDDNEEGRMPTATVSYVPTNWDPVNFVEAAPVLTAVSGT